MEENLPLLVAAEIHMDSATAGSFVAEKHSGAHGELVDFYFGGVGHLAVTAQDRFFISRLLLGQASLLNSMRYRYILQRRGCGSRDIVMRAPLINGAHAH